jgi:ribonuclease VapC
VVIDTSALVAILADEPERDRFIEALAGSEDPVISAATLVEASIVMDVRIGGEGVADLDALLAAAGVRCIAVDLTQARLARDAFARFGRGRSPAALNYGDCFAYALARAIDQPLLFKGDDFAQTDIAPAAG